MIITITSPEWLVWLIGIVLVLEVANKLAAVYLWWLERKLKGASK